VIEKSNHAVSVVFQPCRSVGIIRKSISMRIAIEFHNKQKPGTVKIGDERADAYLPSEF